MQVPILLATLIVAVLVTLYVLAARSWRFAQAIRDIFGLIAWPFAYVGKVSEQGRNSIRIAITWTLPSPLPSPVSGDEEEERHPRGIDVTILRLSYVVFSISIVGGDLPFTQLRNQFLLGLETLTHIPLPLDVLGAIIWLAVSAMLIEWMRDLAGKTPRGATIFQVKHKFWRWVLLAVATLLLALSFVDFALLFYYGQYPASVGELSPDVKVLGLHIVLAFGLTSGVAGALAIAATIRRGWTGLATLVLGLLYCILALLQLPFAMVGKWVGGLGEMIARMQPALNLYPQVNVGPEVYLLPQGQPIEGAIPGKDGKPIMNTKRIIVTFGLGLSNLELLVQTLQILQRLQGEEYLLACGGIDPYHTAQRIKPLPPMLGATNITPDAEEISQAAAGSGGTDETFEILAQLTVSKITEAFVQHLSVTGVIFVFADMRMATFMRAPLERLKNSLPMAKVVLITSLPISFERDERVAKALQIFKGLQQNRSVDAVIVTDPASPLARKRGRDVQTAYVAHTLAGLFVASHHDDNNPSLPETVDLLRALSPLGLSFDSEHVAAGREPLGWWLLRLIRRNLPPKGWADVYNAVTKMKQTIIGATSNPDNLGTNVPISANTPFIALLTAPVQRSRKRRSDFFAENVLRDFGGRFPHALAIIVRANGIPNFKLGQGFFCTAACLYPLIDETLMLKQRPMLGLPGHEQDQDTQQDQGTQEVSV